MRRSAELDSVMARFPDACAAALDDLRARTRKAALRAEDCTWHYDFSLEIPVYTGEEAIRIAMGEMERKKVGHPFDRIGLVVTAKYRSKEGYAAVSEPNMVMARDDLPPEVKQFFYENRGFYNMPIDPADDEPDAAPEPGI